MTESQKIIKGLAIALAVFLIFIMVAAALAIVFTAFGGNKLAKEPFDVMPDGEFSSLDLSLSSTVLEIRTGEVFSVSTNNRRIEVEIDDGVLSIEEDGVRNFLNFGDRNDSVLTLTLPGDFVFEEIEIEAGAGKVTVDTLSADRASLKFGAGEVEIGALNTTVETDVEGGAGKITIASGTITALDLEMGIGNLSLRAALVGDSSVDCGVGETGITLLETDGGYSVRASKGLGSLTVYGEDFLADASVGNGSNRLSVSGGIGAIRIEEEHSENTDGKPEPRVTE